MTTVVDEYVDRERRKCNLVVHNIPEPDVGFDERKLQDQTTVTDLARTEFRLNIRVNKAIRLGKKIANKPRLMLITLDSEDSKRELLRHATQLRSSTTWGNVYISPDLTPKEREISRKLRDELKRRREEGEVNLTIRGGKIITNRARQITQSNQGASQATTSQLPEGTGSDPVPASAQGPPTSD